MRNSKPTHKAVIRKNKPKSLKPKRWRMRQIPTCKIKVRAKAAKENKISNFEHHTKGPIIL